MKLHVLLLKTGQDAWQWYSDYTVYVFKTVEQLNDFLDKEIKRLYDDHKGYVTDETNHDNIMGELVDILEIQTTTTFLLQPTNNQ